jgi:hypothetical protein
MMMLIDVILIYFYKPVYDPLAKNTSFNHDLFFISLNLFIFFNLDKQNLHYIIMEINLTSIDSLIKLNFF